MQQLPVFLNLSGEPVLLLGAGDAADAKRRLIEAAGGKVVDAGAARIAFIAIDDEAEAERTAARLRKAGVLVNVVDRPRLCDFTVPAIVDRSPVIVAVGTAGHSATLAKALRERLEALLPAGLGTLAERLKTARPRIAARFADPALRRRALDALMAPGAALDPLGEESDVEAALETAGDGVRGEHLEIALSSDDPDELTLRQARFLARADVIVAEADVPAAVLDRARRDALRLDAAAAANAGGLVVTLRRAP